MSSSSSSGAISKSNSQQKKGKLGIWKYKLYYDPEADVEHGEDYCFTDEEVLESMNNLIEDDEEIDKVTIYKCPLFDWQKFQLIFHHQFVVFETND